MKERPILFKAEMVRAILDGRKTQTRRVIAGQPELTEHGGFAYSDRAGKRWLAGLGGCYAETVRNFMKNVPCTYGQQGDQLWVRETWRIGAWNEDEEQVAIDYFADGYCRKEWLDVPLDERDMFSRLWQQSTDDAIKALGQQDKYKWEPGQSPCRKRTSIHMPRWASRIQLEITNVRVERLQDISEADAEAEGCFALGDCECTARRQYGELWESINGTGSWNTNPWVWVIEFKVAKS